jgi:hypothetical protein
VPCVALAVGLAAGLAWATPIGGLATANAAPLHAVDQARGGGGFGRVGSGHFRGHGTVSVTGTVASAPSTVLTATSFTITPLSDSTTVTIDVSSSTAYTEPDVSSPTVSNVLVGDEVVVTGTRTGTGTIDARSVRIPAANVTGTVTSPPSSSMGSFTLTGTSSSTIPILNDTTVMVDLDVSPTTTAYRDPGVSAPTYSNVTTNEEVVVTAIQTGTTTVDATLVRIPAVQVKGTVATMPAPTTAGFTLTGTASTIAILNDTTVTLGVTGSTNISERGVGSPSIQAGDQVTATVTQSGTTTVQALSVVITPPRGHGHHGSGGGSGWGSGGSGGGGQGGGGRGGRGGHGF